MREEEGTPSPKDSGERLGEVMMEGRGMSWDGRFWKRAGCILDRHKGLLKSEVGSTSRENPWGGRTREQP